METDTLGNQIFKPITNCDCGLTCGCEKCNLFLFNKKDYGTNKTVEKKIRKKVLSCSYCPPNKVENVKRNSKQFSKSWKEKTNNKKQFLKKDK